MCSALIGVRKKLSGGGEKLSCISKWSTSKRYSLCVLSFKCFLVCWRMVTTKTATVNFA